MVNLVLSTLDDLEEQSWCSNSEFVISVVYRKDLNLLSRECVSIKTGAHCVHTGVLNVCSFYYLIVMQVANDVLHRCHG